MKKTPKHLNRRQELFCNLYARNIECFGNATEAYSRAYQLPPDKRGIAKTNGTRLLTNAHICKRIDVLMDELLNEEMADREMAYVIKQRDDLRAKVAAYVAVNKVRGRLDRRRGEKEEYTFRWEEDD